MMLPALETGLLVDDLIQRPIQYRPAELPPRLLQTGLLPPDSGELATVVNGLFDLIGGKDGAQRARDYGVAPWWLDEGFRAALWRPFTAFTHWLDYRLFPDTPVLMHAHNILWYALAVLLAARLYRALQPFPAGLLAAALFLLDKNTYFPVMYVANRGFIIALVFGLSCLTMHHRWRTTGGRVWMWLAPGCLLLALLANEAGVSTVAFLIAYALILERGTWRSRVVSLVPAAAVVLGWRAVYVGLSFGVRNFSGYIDPGYAPWSFLVRLAPRTLDILGGQLTGLPPEASFALSGEWQTGLTLVFTAFSAACVVAFVAVLRRDATARFWATGMLLAAVPAATVAPLSKNLGFVALGAFGVVAAFFAGFADRQVRAVMPRSVRVLSWAVAIWLAIVHVPGALAARGAMALASPYVPTLTTRCCSLDDVDMGGRDVVVVNDPTTLTTSVVPADRTYRGRPLPRTIRSLTPGGWPIVVSRPDASTLVLTAKGDALFGCPPLGPMHVCYVLRAINDFFVSDVEWMPGAQVALSGLVVHVLDVTRRGVPRSVAYRFDRPLEAETFAWLAFDWRREQHVPFVPPRVGEQLEIAGAEE